MIQSRSWRKSLERAFCIQLGHIAHHGTQQQASLRLSLRWMVEGITSIEITKLVFRCSLSHVAILNCRVVFSVPTKKNPFQKLSCCSQLSQLSHHAACLLFPHHSLLPKKWGTGSSSQRQLEVPNSNTRTFKKTSCNKSFLWVYIWLYIKSIYGGALVI